jgi:hypothetical protein
MARPCRSRRRPASPEPPLEPAHAFLGLFHKPALGPCVAARLGA